MYGFLISIKDVYFYDNFHFFKFHSQNLRQKITSQYFVLRNKTEK
jgi:hypothetical protein